MRLSDLFPRGAFCYRLIPPGRHGDVPPSFAVVRARACIVALLRIIFKPTRIIATLEGTLSILVPYRATQFNVAPDDNCDRIALHITAIGMSQMREGRVYLYGARMSRLSDLTNPCPCLTVLA